MMAHDSQEQQEQPHRRHHHESAAAEAAFNGDLESPSLPNISTASAHPCLSQLHQRKVSGQQRKRVPTKNDETSARSTPNTLECLQHDWARPKPSKRASVLHKLGRNLRGFHNYYIGTNKSSSTNLHYPPTSSAVSSSARFDPSLNDPITNDHDPNVPDHDDYVDNGSSSSSLLLQSLVKFESIRNEALNDNGKKSLTYTKSNEGWVSTIFILQGRALDRIVFPFLLTVGHAIVYTCLQQLVFPEWIHENEPVPWSDVLLGVVLNSTLIFLLVFRLNRAADRFWTARALWGAIVAEGRMLISGLAVHGTPCFSSDNCRMSILAQQQRDHAIRWVLAFFLAAMESLRGRKVLDGDMFAGILLQHEVSSLETSVHMPLFTVHHVRHHLRQLYYCQEQEQQIRQMQAQSAMTTSQSDQFLAQVTMASRNLTSLETKLDAMMNACGGAERIRATPLPIVYVTHLRTILLLTLLLLPYIYGPTWQWSTIGVVAISAFVWLGIEGTAREVETPFGYRVNDLPMDGYCKGMMSTTIQELRLAAEQQAPALYRNNVSPVHAS